jgi:hypothetical protein
MRLRHWHREWFAFNETMFEKIFLALKKSVRFPAMASNSQIDRLNGLIEETTERSRFSTRNRIAQKTQTLTVSRPGKTPAICGETDST